MHIVRIYHSTGAVVSALN